MRTKKKKRKRSYNNQLTFENRLEHNRNVFFSIASVFRIKVRTSVPDLYGKSTFRFLPTFAVYVDQVGEMGPVKGS